MESFRLKNIIILILALMNLCLLGLLGVRLTTGYSAQAEARQQMVQLFAAEGVSLDDGIIPGATPPAGLTLSRDPDEDEKLAGFLLGDELVMSDGGGGVTTYQSENGSAVFRSDGTFDVVIEQSGETADALCRAFCRAFHYEALAFSLDGEDGSASAVQTYDGAPVVNCTVSFSISGGLVEYIDSNYGQTITLNELSRIAGMSPKYFCSYFHSIIHRTPIDYLNYYRIERACSELSTSDLTLAEVAYRCGFSDVSYFIKTFKRYKGITPHRYCLNIG